MRSIGVLGERFAARQNQPREQRESTVNPACRAPRPLIDGDDEPTQSNRGGDAVRMNCGGLWRRADGNSTVGPEDGFLPQWAS